MKTLNLIILLLISITLFSQKKDIDLEYHSYSYLDYDYQILNLNKNDTSNKNSFRVDAFYFETLSKINNKISTRFTIKLTEKNNENHIYAKYAYINYKFTSNLNLRFGIINSEIQSFINNFWGKRFISENFGAKNKIWNSADLGLTLRYYLNNILKLSLELINGSGYKLLRDNNENKELILTVSSIFVKYIYLSLYGDYTIPFENSNYNFKGTGFIGFKNNIIAIGYGLLLKNKENILSIGHSIYSTLTFFNKYSFHLAVLYYNDDLKLITGINYIYSKNFSLALSTELEKKYSNNIDVGKNQLELSDKLFLSTLIKF